MSIDRHLSPLPGFPDFLEKTLLEIQQTRAKILEDFCRAYLAASPELLQEDPAKLLKRLYLVERFLPGGAEFHFEVRPADPACECGEPFSEHVSSAGQCPHLPGDYYFRRKE